MKPPTQIVAKCGIVLGFICIGVCGCAKTEQMAKKINTSSENSSQSNNIYRYLIKLEGNPSYYIIPDKLTQLCIQQGFKLEPPSGKIISSTDISIPVFNRRKWTEVVDTIKYKEVTEVIKRVKYGVELEPETITRDVPYTTKESVEKWETVAGNCTGKEYFIEEK